MGSNVLNLWNKKCRAGQWLSGPCRNLWLAWHLDGLYWVWSFKKRTVRGKERERERERDRKYYYVPHYFNLLSHSYGGPTLMLIKLFLFTGRWWFGSLCDLLLYHLPSFILLGELMITLCSFLLTTLLLF